MSIAGFFIVEEGENLFQFLVCTNHASLCFHNLALNAHKHNPNPWLKGKEYAFEEAEWKQCQVWVN